MRRELVDELRQVHRQQRVDTPLEADRRARLAAQAGAAAQRATDVRRPDLDVVIERGQPRERPVQRLGAVGGLVGEIGPRDVPDEQRVAGQHHPRRIAALVVDDLVGQVLGAMAGRGDCADLDLADRDHVAGDDRVRPVVGLEIGAVGPRAGRGDQAQPARHVIGVVVRLDHVRDPETLLARQLEVDVDVPARVDDDGLPPHAMK